MVGRWSRFFVAALRAYAVGVQRDAAERATVYLVLGLELGGRGVDTAGERQLDDVELVFQQIVYDLDHALDGHGLLGHDESAIGVGGGKLGLERLALHRVVGVAVPDALFLVHVEHCGQERVVLAQDERVIEILQNVPRRLFDLVTREYHVHSLIHGVLDLYGQDARVAVKVLRFSLKAVETVRVLQVKGRDASHVDILLAYIRRASALPFAFGARLRSGTLRLFAALRAYVVHFEIV